MPIGTLEGISLWRRFLVICGLSAAGVTAPLLDIYGRNPEVFVANRTSGPEIILFGLIVTVAIPLISLVVLWLARLVGVKWEQTAYAIILLALSVAIGFVVSRQVFPEQTWLAVVGGLLVAGLVLMLHRWFRRGLSYFALALPLVLVLFLATSASARLVWEDPEPNDTQTTTIGKPVPLVLIQLDEMPLASIMERDGTVNETLFPNFARLADEGTWYRNALSDSIATTQSVPAILTGKLGEKGLSPSSVDHPENLFTLLAGSYEMHVIEWIADLCPEEICPDYAGRAPARFNSLLRDVFVVYGHLTLPASLRNQIPSIENAWKGFLGDGDVSFGGGVDVEGLPVPDHGERAEWIDWVQRLINGIEPAAPPTLHYAHLEAPHVPWITNPSGTHYERPEDYTEVEGVEGDGTWSPDPRPALTGFQRHLYQIGLLDRLLGKLFERLEEAGSWDDAMVVVIADHGASFVPGEHRRWPYAENRDDLYRIPLFVKYPGQEVGEVIDAPAFGRDVVPTVVDELDIETDWSFDGVSLLQVEGTQRPHEPIWWCCSREGASTDLEVLFAQVERNHTWIPDQSSWVAIAGAGPHAGLIGEDAGSLNVLESEDVRWSLDLGSSLADVDLDDGFIQTFLTGRIELPDTLRSDDLIVVANGRVAGTGYVLRDSTTGGALRALVTEDLLHEGHNEIDILVASGEDAWVAGSPDVLTLELADETGRILELANEGSRRVQVDEVRATVDGWIIEGWAADVSRKQTPDEIYVFVGEELVARGEADTENRNVVRWFDSEDLLMTGFSFDIPAEAIPPEIEQVTVVAEFDGTAVADPVTLPPLSGG